MNKLNLTGLIGAVVGTGFFTLGQLGFYGVRGESEEYSFKRAGESYTVFREDIRFGLDRGYLLKQTTNGYEGEKIRRAKWIVEDDMTKKRKIIDFDGHFGFRLKLAEFHPSEN